MDKNNFSEIHYEDVSIFFDKGYSFHSHFGHKRKTKRFPFHKNLVEFLKDNKQLSVYFTLDEKITAFQMYGDDVLINIAAYIKFCKSIQTNTEGRAQAFLGQHLNFTEILSQEAKDDFVLTNANEKSILGAIKNLDHDTQIKIADKLHSDRTDIEFDPKTVSNDRFVEILPKLLTDKKVQNAFFKNLPNIQIETLKGHLEFLMNNLDKNESYIQNWIDEDEGKFRKQRCLIFGIEYVDPKREGKINEKRFDILAEQNREHHILIELKSPIAEVFNVKQNPNKNDGFSSEYNISPELSRAIPQILSYKKWYQDASPEELEALGITNKKNISKCIIIIGISKEDQVWKDNFDRLQESFNIEIVTYSDLIEKLKNSIKNLEENL